LIIPVAFPTARGLIETLHSDGMAVALPSSTDWPWCRVRTDRASPHYSREMRDQSQAVDIVHNYANGLFGEVFCNEISGPAVWWPGPISGGPMNYSG